MGSYSYDSDKMLFITKSAQYQKNGRNTIALDYDIGTPYKKDKYRRKDKGRHCSQFLAAPSILHYDDFEEYN